MVQIFIISLKMLYKKFPLCLFLFYKDYVTDPSCMHFIIQAIIIVSIGFKFSFDLPAHENNEILHQSSKYLNEVCLYKLDVNFSSVKEKFF